MGDNNTNEIIYTYNKYFSDESVSVTPDFDDTNAIMNKLNTSKYTFFDFYDAAASRRYLFGFLWNEETVNEKKIFKDVYFANIGVKEKSSQHVITSCHAYKCNVKSANIKFGRKIIIGEYESQSVDYCGFYTETIIDEVSTVHVLFGEQTQQISDSRKVTLYIPPKSFFLEGDHQDFFAIEPGKYDGATIIFTPN